MKKPFGMLLAILFVLVGCSNSQPEAPTTDMSYHAAQCMTDVSYGPHERNRMDVYLAAGKGPRPFVMFTHGGGFRRGDKRQVKRFLQPLLESGISVIAINYRFTDTGPFPMQMHDAVRALQFIRHKANEWNLDSDKACLSGGSAGAGISLWIAFHDDFAEPLSEDPVARQSTRVTCAAVSNGQSNYDYHWLLENIGPKAANHPALPDFWGVSPREFASEKAKKIFRDCSPISYLTEDDPPVHMSYSHKRSEAGKDDIHAGKLGLHLKEEMEKIELECTVHFSDDSNTDRLTFIKKHLLNDK